MSSNPEAAAPAPPSGAADYTVTRADLRADRPLVLALWRDHAAAASEAKYQWFYIDHPAGAPTLLLLSHGKPEAQTVGLAALGTRRVRVQGEETTAGILADLLVHPAHRTLFPALLLQRHMRGLAMAQHRFVYGIPNKNSTPIVRRLGYAKVGALVRYSNVLRYGHYLDRYLPRWLGRAAGAVVDRLMPLYFRPHLQLLEGWEGAWSDAVDARYDALWARVAAGFDGVIGERDSRFLSWRFERRPGARHRYFTVTRRGSDVLTAYAVCEEDGGTLHVRDFLADDRRHVRLLLHLLSRRAYRDGYANLSLEFLGSQRLHESMAGAGMIERDQRAFYATFTADDDARLRALDWYVTSADEDQ